MGDIASDIVARALRISRRDPARAVDAAEGLEWLNEIHRSILSDGTPWSFLTETGDFTLTAGQDTYLFSAIVTGTSITSIERVLVVVNTTLGGQPLKGVDRRTLERSFYGIRAQDPPGPPTSYTQINLGGANPTILFAPRPDRAYSMRFVTRMVIPEVTGGATPLLPREQASAVLVPYIAARMWDQQAGGEAAAEAARHDRRHERALQRLIDAYGSAREEDVTFIEPTLYDYLERHRASGGDW